ncbi:MAG: GDP-L-fucose synthase [Rhodocyclaceae bacterium]|nr:GDP-L-fucose synthase [Rhodocyclaceae bacterium]
MQRIFVTGHNGMVGSALVRRLEARGDCEVITQSHAALDLTHQGAVQAFFRAGQIDQVYMAAGKVGGIHANMSYPAEFIYENLVMECNLIHAAHLADVQQLLFLGSSCIYPRNAPQPMHEDALLTGPLESTNEPYAIAKIAGIKLCESYNRQYGRDYRSVMPTNLYGPNDNFHADNSHVIPALIRRFDAAARSGHGSVTLWGSGTPRREFLHVDDLATACLFVMNLDAAAYQASTTPMSSHINVGSGMDCTIREVAEIIARITRFDGELRFDASKPDGMPRKLLDVARLTALGWKAGMALEDGLRNTYGWFVANRDCYRG